MFFQVAGDKLQRISSATLALCERCGWIRENAAPQSEPRSPASRTTLVTSGFGGCYVLIVELFKLDTVIIWLVV